MNTSNHDADRKGIDELAAEWTVRLDGRCLTSREQVELDRWLAADSRHAGALLRARAVWDDLDRLVALSGRRLSESCATVEHGNVEISHPSVRAQEPVRTSLPTANRRWFIAASVMGTMLAGGGAWWMLDRRNAYVSDVGEVRRIALSDGSSMVLNTATEANVNFDRTVREVHLTSGEGLFRVAKDPGRPFVVQAGPISVRAVGTVFSVRALERRVDVTVTEGVVELLDTTGGSPGVVLRRVAANEQATVLETRQVEVESISRGEVERRLAWRDGMVDFSGESLAAAVEEINRHNRRRIVVDDATLAGRPVVGLFRANDPEGFATTVAEALGGQSAVEEDGIHLRRRSGR